MCLTVMNAERLGLSNLAGQPWLLGKEPCARLKLHARFLVPIRWVPRKRMLNEQDAHVTQVAVEGGRRAREPLGNRFTAVHFRLIPVIDWCLTTAPDYTK
jgi:hypothetical protein